MGPVLLDIPDDQPWAKRPFQRRCDLPKIAILSGVKPSQPQLLVTSWCKHQ